LGFFPDVGGTFFLSHFCPGLSGLYLALTGAKITTSDVLFCGVGTHFVSIDNIPNLENALRNNNITTSFKLESILNQFSSKYLGKKGESVIQDNFEAINRCFSADTMEEILERLSAENTTFAKNTCEVLLRNSPTCLKVTLEAWKRSKDMTIEDDLKMELRLAVRLVARQDIQEGVKVVLVDKQRGVRPKWNPSRLEDVSREFVLSFFEPLENQDFELDYEREYWRKVIQNFK